MEYKMEEDVIRSFIKRVRSDSRFEHSLMITMIENQGDHIRASRIASYFVDNDVQSGLHGMLPLNVIHLSRDPKGLGQIGVPTQKTHKARYVRDLNAIMAKGEIHIMDDLILDGTERGKKEEGIKELERQLREFAVKTTIVKNTALGFTKAKQTYTGKDTGPDDRVMVLQLLVYWHNIALLEDQRCRDKLQNYVLLCG